MNVTMLLLFYVFGGLGDFGYEAYGILAPQPGIESAPLAFEGEILPTGPAVGKSPFPPHSAILTWVQASDISAQTMATFADQTSCPVFNSSPLNDP